MTATNPYPHCGTHVRCGYTPCACLCAKCEPAVRWQEGFDAALASESARRSERIVALDGELNTGSSMTDGTLKTMAVDGLFSRRMMASELLMLRRHKATTSAERAIVDACTDWVTDMGICYLCDFERTKEHAEDCPVGALLALRSKP